ncbi:hypothetical protein AAFC00_006431 [Neodothiora populina]|uniref:CNH domain-containing protein n=1 Tax=Neodothiora populina TaxID=2781224 RepID=A0ABR3P561_9PEZI
MLSAFRPEAIYELRQQDKSKIESVLAYGDRLLVGLNSGSLRIYRINEPSDPSRDGSSTEPRTKKPKAVELLREEEKFSRRAVLQLAIIKEANILISLSDSYVSIHNRQTFALQEKLERTKGASSFAVTSNVVNDAETGVPSLVSRLAVAVKRRIIWWTWRDTELEDDVREISLPHSVKSLLWADGTNIMVGMDPGFTLVDITSNATVDIYKSSTAGEATAAGQTGAVRFAAVSSSGMGYMGMGSWVPKPMSTNLREGEVLLAKDVNTLFVNAQGKPLEKRQIPWHSPPEAIGYSYPYLLSLRQSNTTKEGALDVRNPATLSLLQTIPLPNASILHVPRPNISLAHAGKGFLVASDRVIWRMAALSYEEQIDELVSKQKLDEAISLLEQLEDTLLDDKKGKMREIRITKAKLLFEQQKYRPALDLFTDAQAPPARVIALYPRTIAGDLSKIEDEQDTEAEQSSDEQPSNDSETTDDDKKKASPEPAETSQDTPISAQKSMFGRLKGQAKKIDSDAASISSVRTAATARSITRPLEGPDLKAAVMALCSFLAYARVEIQKYLNTDGTLKVPVEDNKPPFEYLIDLTQVDQPDWQEELLQVAKLVDTTLFRSYMHALPSLAGPLFRLDNFCDPHVVEEKLYEQGRYQDLIDFLYGKKLHREALEELARFGKNEAADEVMPALRGPSRTVSYLQALPPDMIDIILEFAEWPLRTEPDIGMEIFIADTENAEQLPRDQVLKFLAGIDKILAVRYLEHIISELSDSTPEFHQRLVDFYLEQLKSGELADDEAKDEAREKLEEFLRTSDRYNKAKTFNQLPSDDPALYESRAIVLSAMGNHKQALQIYVFQIQNYEKAETYCNKIYLASQQTANTPGTPSSVTSPTETSGRAKRLGFGTAVAQDKKAFNPYDADDSTPNIYTTLLSLYLRPPPPHQKQVLWPPALDLLSKHGARLPASATLDLMPNDLLIRELEAYFCGRVRNANSVRNEERITKGLEGVRKVELERELLLGGGAVKGTKGRNRRVVIREDDHCKVCHKRFGNSAIRVYPDNEVIHYGCVGRSGVKRMAAGGDFDAMRRMPWS